MERCSSAKSEPKLLKKVVENTASLLFKAECDFVQWNDFFVGVLDCASRFLWFGHQNDVIEEENVSLSRFLVDDCEGSIFDKYSVQVKQWL